MHDFAPEGSARLMELRSPESHTFETIVGQDLVKRFLSRACEQKRLPHALMFTGPVGVGKHSLMFALAKILVTLEHEPGSQKALAASGKVERGTHPDVMVVQPKSASGQILKTQVEELHDRAHYAPLESPSKVILIAPIEAMNPVAANKLLKLLEEPPPSLYLILCSQQIHQTLPTIRSRCALVRCPPVEFQPLVDWLMEQTGCPERRARTAASLSSGRPGLALEIISGESEERRRKICGELDFFQREGYPSIFRVGRNLLDIAGGSHETASALLFWFRDLLVTSLLSPRSLEEGVEVSPRAPDESLLINRDLAEEIAQTAGRHNPESLARAMEVIFSHRQRHLSRPFIDADLLMEVFLTDLGMALK